MPKDKGAGAEALSPEITETRSMSFSNPIKAFKERRASKATAAAVRAGTSQPTETDAADRIPLVPRSDETPLSATNSHEQDSFISIMRATRGMSPEEVKAYLAQRAQADHEKHKNDVSGLSDGGNMIWMLKN
jgi:hypothetical protein